MQKVIDTKQIETQNYWIYVIGCLANQGVINTELELLEFLSSTIEALENFLEPSSARSVCVGSCEIRSFRELETLIPKRFLSRECIPLSSKYEFAKYSVDCLVEQEWNLGIYQPF